ncbi:kielin/chordin-like protein [Hyalella azteca]|uniref:Kielin/chordin-like protein n=1 Tax=Hyalella azteca TaxID=294128 RepID=A0A979FQB4_HYAAZ|nr:kielin/chordin-like protein [Hyalella azteca]
MDEMEGTRRCAVRGRLYRHGDIFANFTDTWMARCELCVCNDGIAKCAIKGCPSVSCALPLTPPDDCCKICPDTAMSEQQWPSEISFSDPSNSPSSRTRDCRSGERYFLNGSKWHPIIGPFGEMSCVTCRCNNGTIGCARIKCASRSELPCDHPVKIDGRCCPVCQSQNDESSLPSSGGGRASQELSGGGGGRTVKCLPARSTYAVWKCDSRNPITRILQYLFVPLQQPNQGERYIQHHRLILKGSWLEEVTVQNINHEMYSRLTSSFSFVSVGGTNERRIRRLKVLEKELKKDCQSPAQSTLTATSQSTAVMRSGLRQSSDNSCTHGLLRLEDALKLKTARKRDRCRDSEHQLN